LRTQKYVPAYDMTVAYAGLGGRGARIKMATRGSSGTLRLAYLAVEPGLDDLRSEPEFADLMKQVVRSNSG
jgi:hypothetical protein